MTDRTLTEVTPPPAWILRFFEDIDRKTFASGFDIFDEQSVMVFGVERFEGVTEMRRELGDFDSRMDTRHVVKQFYDAGDMKIIRGELTMTSHASGVTETPVFIHIIHLSSADPVRVRLYEGAMGPSSAEL